MAPVGPPRPSEPVSSSRILSKGDADLATDFMALTSRRDVARLLDVPYWQLDWLVRRSAPAARYRVARIKKRNGGLRDLTIPNDSLAILQRKLLQVLSAVFKPRPSVHGFRRQRGVLSNAQAHQRRMWILNVDLEDFFPSINFGRVRGLFLAAPYKRPTEVATLLAQICCYANQLPQGAPTSPIISNMVCAKLDGELSRLAKQFRLTYTRYADDMTFSTRLPKFPPQIASIALGTTSLGPDLMNVLTANGFKPNSKKTRLQRRGQRQQVTGLRVNEFANVPRTYIRRVRAMLHAWEKHGEAAAQAEFHAKWDRKDRRVPNPAFPRVLRGKISYIQHVRGKGDTLVQGLWRRYAALDPSMKASLVRTWREAAADAMWVLECEEQASQGTAFAVGGYTLLTCHHVLGTKTMAFQISDVTKKYAVKVIHACSARDLAFVELEAPTPNELPIDESYQPNMGDHVFVAGFPNYRVGDTGYFAPQSIGGIRPISTRPHCLTTGPIAAGMSGGPVLSSAARVIGVVVTGADDLNAAQITERHGFIPASVVVEFLAEAQALRASK